ncbi:MAG: TolC family protein [Planctomycetes bacterium]|nr:TolC family protein [Planctomycetota bacterium]
MTPAPPPPSPGRRLALALVVTLGIPLALPLALVGCAAPEVEPEGPDPWFMHAPPAWSQGAAPIADDGAPLPTTLTLRAAIAETVARSRVLRAGAEDVEQARADQVTAGLRPNPTLMSAATLLPLRRFTERRPGGPPQFDAAVSYPLDWLVFGKREAAMESARKATRVADATVADLARQEVAATIATFYDVLEARALVELSGEQLEDLDRLLALTERRAGIGAAGQVDVDRVRLAHLEGRLQLQQDALTLAAAEASLRALVGRTPEEPEFEVDGDLLPPVGEPRLDPGELRQLAERHRPDLLAARREVERAEAELVRERREARPELAFELGLTYQYQEPIGDPDAPSFGLGFNLELPLFDRNQGNIRRAASQVRQAEHLLRALRARLDAELTVARRALELARAAATGLGDTQVEAARSVRDRIEAAHRIGARSVLELIDAQMAYREVLRQQASRRADYWRAIHQLNAVLGREVLP